MQIDADEAYARSIEAQQLRDAQAGADVRGRRREASRRRAELARSNMRRRINRLRWFSVVYNIFHVLCLAVLVLQLTKGGFPRSFDELLERVRGPSLYTQVWFLIIASATAFPLLGLIGTIIEIRSAVWTYCIFIVADIGELRLPRCRLIVASRS